MSVYCRVCVAASPSTLDPPDASPSGAATNCQAATHATEQSINTPEKHGRNVHTVNARTNHREPTAPPASAGSGRDGCVPEGPRLFKSRDPAFEPELAAKTRDRFFKPCKHTETGSARTHTCQARRSELQQISDLVHFCSNGPRHHE